MKFMPSTWPERCIRAAQMRLREGRARGRARSVWAAALAGSALFVLAGAPLGPAGAATVSATIADMAFAGLPATLHVGDVVVWTNRDFVAHTVTAKDGSFNAIIPPGKTGRTTMKHAGQIAFFCTYHPTMTGTANVVR